MKLWQRAPREVYRVYGEDEYLGGDAPYAPGEDRAPSVAEGSSALPVAEQPSLRSNPGRLVGLGLLVGVVVSAAALVVLNEAHRPVAPPPAAVAQVAAHASTGGSIGRRSVVGVSNRPAPRVRARARTHTRGAPGSFTVRHPTVRFPSARLFSARPTGRVSTASTVESAQPHQPSLDASWSGARAFPVDGEFGFER